MNKIEDVLQYVDDLINLTPVQEAILKGTWEGKKCWEIGEDFNNCSESHIKKEAAKLWKKLGKKLDENVKKSNVRSKLEKKYHRISQISSYSCMQVGDINICDKSLQVTKNTQMRSPFDQSQNQEPIIDLTEAPQLECDYGRTLEISTLKEWILENKTRLITIYGLSGIGKTALTLKLIPEIQTEFDYIIYKSFNDKIRTLINFKDELKQIFSQSEATSLLETIDYFRSFRCLVILDDVQNIFKSGDLASQYLPEYKNYNQFFQQIANNHHQSCLILISREKLKEMTNIQTLYLKGLGEEAKEILNQKCLKDEEKWDELIALYQGHPFWLNSIANTIYEFYHGRVAEFLAEENELFLDDLEAILETHLEHLSPLEKNTINWLAIQEEMIDIAQKTPNIEITKYEFLAVIKSLVRRCLVEKETQKGRSQSAEVRHRSYFYLNSVFKAYIIKT